MVGRSDVNTIPKQKITFPSNWLASFCRRNQIRRLTLFGSVLRDDFHDGSDVDVLVEYESGAGIGYFDMMRMQQELSDKLGKRVDLRTPAELSKHFRQRVQNEALVQYVHR